MRRTRLLRLFWIGTAAILVAAALVALAAVVQGRFDDTDGTILATLGTALLAGTVATAGAALVEARTSALFGLAVAVTAPVWFAIDTAAMWDHFSGTLGDAAVTGYAVLAAELVVATARVLVGGRRHLLPLFGATATCVAIATTIALVGFWSNDFSSGAAKALAAFWILGVLCYLLIPVARRLSTPDKEGEARRVDLTEGLDFAGVRLELADGRPGRRETLYVVVEGRIRGSGLELGPGEAAIFPAGPAPRLASGARVLTIK